MSNSIISFVTMLSLIMTVLTYFASIVRNVKIGKKYHCAKNNKINMEFPSSQGFSKKDLEVIEEFCVKFRGSVRLGSLNIYTDEKIEQMRELAKIPLP